MTSRASANGTTPHTDWGWLGLVGLLGLLGLRRRDTVIDVERTGPATIVR
jgi:MYXO-CTERM domain-containing protein